MESNFVKALNGKYSPIVFLKTNELPENATIMKEGSRGCLMHKIAKVIRDRETFVVSKETCSCPGAFPGLGFGSIFNEEQIANHASFLSQGLESAPNKESFEEFISCKPKPAQEFFKKGERIFVDYEDSYNFVKTWQSNIIEGKYAVFKPLEDLKDEEIPISVIFTLNPNELAAVLSVNSSINKRGIAQINTNAASACQSIAWEVYNQDSNDLKPVLGLLDLAGRKSVKPIIGQDYLNLSFPWEIFLKLEDNVEKSILNSTIWD